MATLNLSANGPSIKRSYQSIVDAPAPSAPSSTYAVWALFSVQAPLTSAFQQDSSKESVLKVQTTGEGELLDLIDEFSDGRIQFAFAKVKDPNSGLPKSVLIAWCGEGVPERTKGYFNTHLAAVSKLLHGYHVQITARSESHLSPESIIEKVSNSSGAKYGGGPSTSDSASRAPPPPAATKPVFMPTRTGGSLLASRPKPAAPTSTDNDGWGDDAPQVSRSTLEKVESAYKPTKVNMAELTSQKQQPSRFQPPTKPENDGPSDVVKGGYQPIGKVDINAIRRQAQEQGRTADDRPTIVKGAYEPVGKVDIAAIRAKAQGAPSPAPAPAPVSQSPTGGDDGDEAPKSLAERSAAFSQSGRLNEMPKPKVANRFGSSTSSFAGTKAPTPVGLGQQPTTSAPIGAASKNFANADGKSPAQLWAEKKARERGLSGAADTAPPSAAAAASPIPSQPSGGWQSGYSGKSWAPVQTNRTGTSNISAQKTGQDESRELEQDAEPEIPSGGVSALKDRFKNAAPMGAAASASDDSPAPPMPPPMDLSSKPNAGRAIPPPPQEEDERPEEEHVSLPPPPAQPRSPTPSPPSSPVRIAMPVARGQPDPIEPPEERFSPPPMPTESISIAASAAAAHAEPEPQVEADDPARHAAEEAAASTFGAGAAQADPGAGVSGKRAVVQYDYEKAEDNEIELREGDYVTNIEMVDEDWWMGQNSQGETGLFPSNYVELVEDDSAAAAPPAPSAPARNEPAAPPAPAAPAAPAAGNTATAQYDYEAAEDNELSFPDGAKITNVEFPDEDWWFGEYNGQQGLFPANYVELDQ